MTGSGNNGSQSAGERFDVTMMEPGRPFGDDLVEVLNLREVHLLEAEVVDDEQVGGEEAPEFLLPTVVCPSRMQIAEQSGGLDDQN